MSLALSSRIKLLAVLALASLPQAVEAQYGYPYGYRRRRTGWRNIYLVAILIPIAAFFVLWMLWFWVFRAILRRRRQNNAQTLPTTTTTSYPVSDGYNNGYTANTGDSYANNGAGYTAGSGYGNTTGGAAAGYYGNGNNDVQPQMSEAYTKPPQQAYHPAGQESYAPPAGAPPSGYGGENGGYAPPSGAPLYGR